MTPTGIDAAAPRAVGFALEPGERILWQGRPKPRALRRHLMKVRWVAAYFAALLVWKIVLIGFVRGLHPQELVDVATLLVEAGALSAVLAYFAWALARGTTYTVTDLRVIIHHGIALQGTVDIPLRALRKVAVRVHDDGCGDVALGVREGSGVGYSKLWPHVQGLAATPMLRGLPDAAVLGSMLARGLDGPAVSARDDGVPHVPAIPHVAAA